MSWEKTILTFDIKKVNDDDDDNHDDNFQKGLVTQSTTPTTLVVSFDMKSSTLFCNTKRDWEIVTISNNM